MGKYRIAWLPGDGVGLEVLEAARVVLEKLQLDAEYIHGDIGWEFWRREGDALPPRTIELLRNVDAALFGCRRTDSLHPRPAPPIYMNNFSCVTAYAPTGAAAFSLAAALRFQQLIQEGDSLC